MSAWNYATDPFYRAMLADITDTEWQIVEADFMGEKPPIPTDVAPGDLVRIIRIPDWLTHDLPIDEAQRLRELGGSRMRVLEIDAYGYLWFGDDSPWFCLRREDVELLLADSASSHR